MVWMSKPSSLFITSEVGKFALAPGPVSFLPWDYLSYMEYIKKNNNRNEEEGMNPSCHGMKKDIMNSYEN